MIEVNPRLIGPKLKVERADEHIIEISALIDAFLAPDPYVILTEHDTVAGETRLRLCATQQPPTNLSVRCGEVLYLLRSALDHAVTAVATQRGATMIERTGFPIEETRQKFESTLDKRKIKQRLPVLAEILSLLQPYKGGNDYLWWLHWLNGAEKHQALVTVAAANVGVKIAAEFKHTGQDLTFKYPQTWQPLDENNLPIVFVHPIGLQIDGDMDISMNVAFSDIKSSQPYTLTDTLQQMSSAVVASIAMLDAEFFSA